MKGRSPGEKIIRTTCGFCAIGCGLLAHTKGGSVVRIEGDPEHPLNRGSLCAKGRASLEGLYHPDRLTHPLKRKGERGGGSFEEISWDEALDTIAAHLERTKRAWGASSAAFVHGAAKGLQDSYLARFANLYGSPNVAWQGHVCFVPRVAASRLTYGFYAIPDYDFPPKCVIVWGKNMSETLPHAYERLLRARERGTRLIVIDSRRTDLAEWADVWLQPRPGSDLLLALGMINILISEGLYDRAFVERWTVGFDELREHCKATSLKEVARRTWVPEGKIREAATLFARSKPAAIQWGNPADQGVNSFPLARSLCLLRALTGNLGVPGGEAHPERFPLHGRRSPELEEWGRMQEEVFNARVGIGGRPFPMIRYVQPQDIISAILDETPTPIRMVYNQGGNPLVSYSNARRVHEALKKLDFFVVAEQFMTPTAALADIVLPVTTFLEFPSIVTPPYSYPVMSVQQPCVRIGSCKSDYEILRDLAGRMGFGDDFWETEEACLDFVLEPMGITFEEMKRIGIVRGTLTYRDFEKNGFATPSGKVELTISWLREKGFDALPMFREPMETSPEFEAAYPFIYTTWKTEPFRHSAGRQIPSLRQGHPRPVVIIHPETARELGIDEGDEVAIETPYGRIRQTARLSDILHPRVVGIDYAWWFPEADPARAYGWESANVNLLTPDHPPYNPELGSTNLRGGRCRLIKI